MSIITTLLPTKTPIQWENEIRYIQSRAAVFTKFTHWFEVSTFIQYCTTQAQAAMRDGKHQVASMIEKEVERLRAFEEPAVLEIF